MKPLWVDKLPGWARRDRRYWVNLPLLAGLYFGVAKFGLALAHTTRQITAVWPASGLALVLILVLGYSYWPAVYLGSLAANWSDKEALLVAAVIAVGNTLEAAAGAWIIRRLGHPDNHVDTPQAAGAVGIAAILSSLIAATVGSTSLALGGVIAWDMWTTNWVMWWGGDVLGTILFGTALLVALDRQAYGQVRGRMLEGGLLLASVFGASMVLFTTGATPFSRLHFYLLFPFIVWAALRFTRLGVAATTMTLSAVGVWATVNRLGPLAVAPVDQVLVQFLLFVLVTSATSLLLAMAIDQRQAAVAALQAQTHHLESLESDLKDANRRVTDILAGILKDRKADDEDQNGPPSRWI